jgi:hypothetical protein
LKELNTPKLAPNQRLSKHVLYRIKNKKLRKREVIMPKRFVMKGAMGSGKSKAF